MTAKRIFIMFQKHGKEMLAGLTELERSEFKLEYKAIFAPLQPSDPINDSIIKQIRDLMWRFEATEDIWNKAAQGIPTRKLPTSQHYSLSAEQEEIWTVQQFPFSLIEDTPNHRSEPEEEVNTNPDAQQSSTT